MKPAEVKALNPRLSPKLDVFLGGSNEVNAARAEQCPSVALPEPAAELDSEATGAAETATPAGADGTSGVEAPEDGARPIRILQPEKVARLAADLEEDVTPTQVSFSAFVQIDRDLDPEAHARAVSEVREHATRVRWKLDTASVETTASGISRILAIPGVSYVEPGQTLRGPEPVVGTRTGPPDRAMRKIATQSRRHGYGHDVLVGIIDVGGFDFAHSDFLDRDGQTRWVAIWDQGGTTRPPPSATRPGDREALHYGSEILQTHMNAAIAASSTRRMAATALEPQSQMRIASHGTHVASIAAGNRGVARRAMLAGVLVVLRPEDTEAASSFYDSTRIADAVDYLLDLAAELGKKRNKDGIPLPLSINISLGTNGHAHDTSSTMARWIDNALATRGRCVSVAAGNAGQVEPRWPGDMDFVKGRIHAGGSLPATSLRHELGWMTGGEGISDVSENELEIWYGPQDRFDVEVKPPGLPWLPKVPQGSKIRNEVLKNGTVLSVYNEAYHPANGLNRISVVLSPFFGEVAADGSHQIGPIATGEWRVRLTGVVVRDGRFDAWIERDDPRRLPGTGNQWAYPSHFAPSSYTSDRMINSLACAERILAVANADLGVNAAHITSSRGPTRDGRSKPDIAADGTKVVAARGFDRAFPWIEMTGTSMASPFVCGVAALMLGLAPWLTSAQIQGIMRSTSAPLPGQTFGWRNDTGFGVIDGGACLARTAEFVDMHRAMLKEMRRKEG
ncbi:S8 family serine peptidase [Nostocoides sp. F2B08]|uniref:S8 family serine peptidase n=1 Tax=Nostocoides sp. F2B08 TaxID=2653936 RepID=UPI001262D1EC|nr:S8 family serine peptidase [Tetrasphaera sp. F2B08]KAB7743305.1 S8 family serine peptidase [Tetrasphaera sp. F2B08]